MAYRVPAFLKRSGDSLLFNLVDKECVFYIPEEFFSTNNIALIDGAYLSTLGIFNYCIRDIITKKDSGIKTFNFPTIFLSKPDRIEKVKGLKLKNLDEMDYRLAIFKLNDEVVSSVKVPQIIDNVEILFKLFLITGRIPAGLRYDKLQNYFKENINLNGADYGIQMQLFGIVFSELCRDPKDISKPFRLSKMEDMTNFKSISVKGIPNNVSPFVSLTSENFDESLMSSIIMDQDKYSPLEKILTL